MPVESPHYMPTQAEIEGRMELLQWMQRREWSWYVIDSIMYDDNPTPDHVHGLIWQNGPVRAYKILKRFLRDKRREIPSTEEKSSG
jgi:hypothetical protein